MSETIKVIQATRNGEAVSITLREDPRQGGEAVKASFIPQLKELDEHNYWDSAGFPSLNSIIIQLARNEFIFDQEPT